MTTLTLPPISSLTTLPAAARAAVLDALFEPCPTLHSLSLPVLGSTRFESYEELIAAVRTQLSALAQNGDITQLDEILGAHPRLGAQKVDSAQSAAEQAQLNTGGAEEASALAALNRDYEDRFPGLRYVVFVNGRSRAVIMENMQARIERGDISAERREAIEAMCDIAADRARKLLQHS